ncbi:hypothetical protein [Rothia sp. P5766]|uniref:hypothetical protein n=1 Tax=Rothia sp. P5766 TaxID=3402656 RepID=UPI003AE2DBCE
MNHNPDFPSLDEGAQLPAPHSFRDQSVKLASAILRQELLSASNRAIWSKHTASDGDPPSQTLSVRAISRAIAAHCKHYYGQDCSSSRYKDRVSRAIRGEHISLDTLNLFTETFSFSPSASANLHEVLTTGIETDEMLGMLRVVPQASIVSSFTRVDLAPSDQDGEDHVMAHINAKLLSLETGCSALLLPLSATSTVTVRESNFLLSRLEGGPEWVFTPMQYIPPLQTFMLRFSVLIQAPAGSEGFRKIHFPLATRVHSTGIRVETGGQKKDIEILLEGRGSKADTTLIHETVEDYSSCFIPLLSDDYLVVRWR